jgi:hypothetical protein
VDTARGVEAAPEWEPEAHADATSARRRLAKRLDRIRRAKCRSLDVARDDERAIV